MARSDYIKTGSTLRPRNSGSSRNKPSPKPSKLKYLLLVVLLVAAGLYIKHDYLKPKPATKSVSSTTAKTSTIKNTNSATAVTNVDPATNPCSDNKLSQLVLVSVSQRHLWACSGTTQAYDSPVITGMQFLKADLTPVGTYHVYAKITNTVLTGHDSTGSWSDPVSYWMPWLDNQYGEYGFHDATWRPSNAFGNISPYSSSASHGCVECPLATAAWLYSWVTIGTTVTIES